MIGFNAISATFPSVSEQILEKDGVPVALVLRRNSDTEAEKPITMMSSELESDEMDAFADKGIFDQTAVGSINIETSDQRVSIKELYLLPLMKEEMFELFVQQVLQQRYPENKISLDCSIQTS